MRIVFFGTSDFAAHILQHVLSCQDIEIVAIVTRPDRPVGRSLVLGSPPVKQYASMAAPHTPVYQPEKASSMDFEGILRGCCADLFVVVAYGEILKKSVLILPRWASINVHASLLPKYRGAAPMQRALMNGDVTAGVTIIEMAEKMDAGAMLGKAKMQVEEGMTYGDLKKELQELGAHLLVQVMRSFAAGSVCKQQQSDEEATYAPKIAPEEEKIIWKNSAIDVHNHIRALAPQPGAWCYWEINGQKKRLKIRRSEIARMSCEFDEGVKREPGEVICFTPNQWTVSCGNGAINILEMQLEGKKNLSLSEFVNGSRGYPRILL